MFPLAFKIVTTLIVFGVILVAIAAVLQSVFHMNQIADYFGYTGLMFMYSSVTAVVLWGLHFVWTAK